MLVFKTSKGWVMKDANAPANIFSIVDDIILSLLENPWNIEYIIMRTGLKNARTIDLFLILIFDS